MAPFNYRRINQQLIQQVGNEILNNESVVILGPRYSAKRYLIDKLHTYLETIGINPIIKIKIQDVNPIITENQFYDLILKSIPDEFKYLYQNKQSVGEFFEPIDILSSEMDKPIVLIVANVDSLAHHLAQHFLKEVRTKVESGKLTVILSGEDDFRHLVYGPNSEFNCANQFVIQGLARDEFEILIPKYAKDLNIEFENSEEILNHLWKLTGGNNHLAELLLVGIVASRIRSNKLKFYQIKTSDIPDSLRNILIAGTYGQELLRHSIRLIARSPESWEFIEKLIKGETVKINFTDGLPTPLELAGMAIREDMNLRFASPLMEDFIKGYYDNKCFGDLYARYNKWDKAFIFYEKLLLEERLRPSSIDDKHEVEVTINELCSALYSAATKDINIIKELFIKGCQYILGFNGIIFLNWSSVKGWQLQQKSDTEANENVINTDIIEVIKNLPVDNIDKFELLTLPAYWRPYALASILPSIRSNQKDAVIVCDIKREIAMSRERKKLANELIQHFIKAYKFAISVERDRLRLTVRNKQIEIINSIFHSLGSNVLNVGNAIEMAAYGLHNLDYDWVRISLVFPEENVIRVVYDENTDSSSSKPTEKISWRLDKPEEYDQSYVIQSKKPKIIENSFKAEAIIPILNPFNEAIGTIHVRRKDNNVPTQEEVEDLMEFGRQLAVGIEQSERVNMLQTSLDKIPEPIVIIDKFDRIRYSNKPAHKIFGIRTGWREIGIDEKFTEKELQLNTYLNNARKQKIRIFHNIVGLDNNPNFYGSILIDNIQDKEGRMIGSLMHIQDQTSNHKIFGALKLVAGANDTNSAIHSMLEASKVLEHKWGRLYVIESENNCCLVSLQSFGFKNEEKQKSFNNGGVKICKHGESGAISWKCIEEKAPIIFCWNENKQNGEQFMTSNGLNVINLNPPLYPEEIGTTTNDFWIDFPLMAQDKVFGKISIQCEEKVSPEEFEQLKTLSEGAASILDSFIIRDSWFKEREQWIRSASEETVALTTHNIATRLASLPVLLSRYKMHFNEFPELNDINKDFEKIISDILDVVKRAKERLSPVCIHPQSIDIEKEVRNTLLSSLPDENMLTVQCPEKSLIIDADYHLLGSAILELIENSKYAILNNNNGHITVNIESIKHDSEDWVKIIYKDSGPGIPIEMKEKIFGIFFSHRPGQKKGTGLGLCFVRRVIEAHGGTIREIGELGKGAEFVIEIPRYAMAH